MTAHQPHPADASDFFDKIAAQITATGPLTLAAFMLHVLADPDHGYYINQDPFGSTGDFTTAPEISGLFGEMCGLYLAHMAEIAGLNSPADTPRCSPAILELGPGRGSLMADMQNVWQKIIPPLATAPVHLVETSPYLRHLQRDKLGASMTKDTPLYWHDDVTNLPAAPIIAIANEFFDALPLNQAVWRSNEPKTSNDASIADGRWYHRLVGLANGRLAFCDGPPLDPATCAAWHLPATMLNDAALVDGSIAENTAMADAYMGQLASHIATYGGACLIIDYGRDGQGGDSLQAVADHQPVDVFYQPGKADLSHWVDFSALRRSATAAGARFVGPVTQGAFLQAIGILQRAEAAASLADTKTRRGLYAAIDRLVSNQQMGSAFKVALVLPPGTGTPPGFDTSPVTGSTEQKSGE